MGLLNELYAAPDYLDERRGGVDTPNTGNEGAKASEGVGRYGGGMTGSSWADESHHPNDPGNPRNGPAGAISTNKKLETGGGYRSPGAPGHIDMLRNVQRANSINPDGNQVAANDPNAHATRPYSAGSDGNQPDPFANVVIRSEAERLNSEPKGLQAGQ